jgi:hypothetical protein
VANDGARTGGDQTGRREKRINLIAVEAALRRLQHEFPRVSRSLRVRRDAMDDQVVRHLLDGYAYVDALVAAGIDTFALGQLKHLLELNSLVLCGGSSTERAAHEKHLEATERRFYEERDGGIRDVVEWLAQHAGDSVWDRAAGTYVRMLSKPQLFIEGNHRTGVLVASYVLVREGKAPFVLTPENATAYFDLSRLLRDSPKQALMSAFRLRRTRKRLAALLREYTDERLLLT